MQGNPKNIKIKPIEMNGKAISAQNFQRQNLDAENIKQFNNSPSQSLNSNPNITVENATKGNDFGTSSAQALKNVLQSQPKKPAEKNLQNQV